MSPQFAANIRKSIELVLCSPMKLRHRQTPFRNKTVVNLILCPQYAVAKMAYIMAKAKGISIAVLRFNIGDISVSDSLQMLSLHRTTTRVDFECKDTHFFDTDAEKR